MWLGFGTSSTLGVYRGYLTCGGFGYGFCGGRALANTWHKESQASHGIIMQYILNYTKRLPCTCTCTPHSFKDLWPYGQVLLQHVQEMINKGVIQIKNLPVDEAKAHIMAAWDWAEKSNIFRAHQEGDPSFETKKLIYFNLVASLGFASGKWQRPVLAHIREPISVPQAGVQWLPRLFTSMLFTSAREAKNLVL